MLLLPLNSLEIEELLLSKGLPEEVIRKNKKRRVIGINSDLYDFIGEKKFASIPTCRIAITHRLMPSNSWWECIFNNTHNCSMRKWNKIQKKFEETTTIDHFRKWFISELPPIESAIYYLDLDLYTVEEGHHRTCWAILTDVPEIKVQYLKIKALSEEKLLNRKLTLNKLIKIVRKIKAKEKEIFSIIKSYNFTYDKEFIRYKDYPIISFTFKNYTVDTDDYILYSYLTDIESFFNLFSRIIKLDLKFKWWPIKLRIMWLKTKLLFNQCIEEEILVNLYIKGWEKN